jgi:predicted nucleotidyltransferase component of viral defense system
LEQKGLLNNLVFQGGTLLRLCYGGNRFSEDLDFAGGSDFSSTILADIKDCIEQYVGGRYGLTVTVKEPKTLKEEDPKYAELNIDKWQISVTTAPNRKELPRQRIKIEVANIPAYTKDAVSLNANYEFLPDGYSDLLLFAESKTEVMADKLVSLPATQKYIRYRDIWDLVWLKQQGAELNVALVQQKIDDYKLTNFTVMLRERIDSIPSILAGTAFKNEMKRFIPTDVYERTLNTEKFDSYLMATILELLQGLQHGLNDPANSTPEFMM